MARRPAFLRLIDMAAALDEIARATRERTFDDFRGSRALRSQIERELEIVSEASRHLDPLVIERHPQIPWKKVADFANWTRHSYDQVDEEIVWDIATRQLPIMQQVIDTERSRPDFPRYPAFEDFVPGEITTYGRYAVTREEAIEFSSEFDPQPFHLTDEGGKASLLGALSASGWHSSAMLMRMNCDHFVTHSTSMGGPGIEEMKWVKPVFPGDVLSVRRTILDARVSASKPDRGIVRFRFELLNQNGEVVLIQVNPIFFGRRTAEAAHV